MNSVLFSSKSPHWPTPKALLDELNREFQFDFDPCPLGESENDGSAPLFTSCVWRDAMAAAAAKKRARKKK